MQSDRRALMVSDNQLSFWKTCYATSPRYRFIDEAKVCRSCSAVNDALMNAVLSSDLSQMSDAEITKTVDYVIADYEHRQVSFCWWVNLLQDPAILRETLKRRGFTLFGAVSSMIADLERALPPVPTVEGVEIILVRSKADLEDWVIPIAASFSMSPESATCYVEIFESLHDSAPDTFLHFVAKSQGQIIASSTLFLGEIAGLYNGATLASHRNRGIVTALGLTMLHEAKSRGFKKATLQASPMSVNLCRQGGFEEVVPHEVYLKHDGP